MIPLYDARPTVTIEQINHELGEFWFLLHEYEPLAARVPADIASGMPVHVKSDNVRELWGIAARDALTEFAALVASWEHLHAGAIPSSEPAYRDVHAWTELAGLFALAYLFADHRATVARWNGREPIAAQWRDKATLYDEMRAVIMIDVRAAFRCLKTEQPLQYDGLGFTDAMLRFMGLDHLI